jgi:hypothetical protein
LIAALIVAPLLAGCASSLAQQPPGQPLHTRTRSSDCVARGALPDAGCTPGSIRTSDSRAVCVPGSSRRARNVSPALKRAVYRSYGIRRHRRGAYEVDHLVPLELGGANDIANLWPQPASPAPGYHEKDGLENALHELVCGGRVSLDWAQRAIARDWVSARAWVASRFRDVLAAGDQRAKASSRGHSAS